MCFKISILSKIKVRNAADGGERWPAQVAISKDYWSHENDTIYSSDLLNKEVSDFNC